MKPSRGLPPSSPFAGDDGSCSPELAAALGEGDGGRTAAVVAALAHSRVLVPLVAHAEPGEAGERATSTAVVTVAGPDGRAVLPVFSSVEAMRRWDAAARPIPVEGPRAAVAALADGDGLLVLDPAGPVSVLVPRPAASALALGRAWVPAPEDPAVTEAVVSALAGIGGLAHVSCAPGSRAELAVVLAVVPGLDRPALDGLVSAVQGALAAAEVVAERVDSLELRIVRAS